MDARDEQFWVQAGTKAARNLAASHGSAHRLKRSADVLRAQWKSDLVELYRRMPSGRFAESVGGPMMLLAGFAVENLAMPAGAAVTRALALGTLGLGGVMVALAFVGSVDSGARAAEAAAGAVAGLGGAALLAGGTRPRWPRRPRRRQGARCSWRRSSICR